MVSTVCGCCSDMLYKTRTYTLFSLFLLKNYHSHTIPTASLWKIPIVTQMTQFGWQVNIKKATVCCHLLSASSACAEEQFSADWRQNENLAWREDVKQNCYISLCKDLFSLNVKDKARKHTWTVAILAKTGCSEREIILNISMLPAVPTAVSLWKSQWRTLFNPKWLRLKHLYKIVPWEGFVCQKLSTQIASWNVLMR